jgi:hypothetical protein
MFNLVDLQQDLNQEFNFYRRNSSQLHEDISYKKNPD